MYRLEIEIDRRIRLSEKKIGRFSDISPNPLRFQSINPSLQEYLEINPYFYENQFDRFDNIFLLPISQNIDIYSNFEISIYKDIG